MPKIKTGDLIAAAKNGEVNVIAHQCNCMINMGAGIAPQIKKSFPEAWYADSMTVKGDHSKLGTFTVATSGNVRVYNLYGQHHWKKNPNQINTDYQALTASLLRMADDLKSLNTEIKIGLPKIGCGLGGGDWQIVSEIIQETLADYDVTIYCI